MQAHTFPPTKTAITCQTKAERDHSQTADERRAAEPLRPQLRSAAGCCPPEAATVGGPADWGGRMTGQPHLQLVMERVLALGVQRRRGVLLSAAGAGRAPPTRLPRHHTTRSRDGAPLPQQDSPSGPPHHTPRRRHETDSPAGPPARHTPR